VHLAIAVSLLIALAGCSAPPVVATRVAPAPAIDPELVEQAGAVVVAVYQGPLDRGDHHGVSPQRFRIVRALKGNLRAMPIVTPAGVPEMRGYAPKLQEGVEYVLYVAAGEATANLVSGKGPAPGLPPYAFDVLAIYFAVETPQEAGTRRAAEARWKALQPSR
jgi:hypothetical protein